MRSNARWEERIGAVFLPEAEAAEVVDDADDLPRLPPIEPVPFPFPFPRLCLTQLKQGCYTVEHTPTSATLFSARFRGTLRVELTGAAPRISGDFYRYRLIDPSVIGLPVDLVRRPDLLERLGAASDEAADTTTIPVYSRRSYNSYLRGTRANLVSRPAKGEPCRFSLEFEQFTYSHPASGFSGSFPTTPSRRVKFALNHTGTPDLFTGQMHELLSSGGTALLGSVSIRWISPFFRRARVQLNTLTGAVAPPTVGTNDIRSIFGDSGWDVTVTDGGSISLPAALSGVTTTACWSEANLHALMQSVPGYNAADLDSQWRVHLVAVPATLGCSRGIMFDSATLGADPNAVPREGAATFSHDGYPAGDFPASVGSQYDTATGQQQRNVPRAYLRSATHEVGHAFNQIHQSFEGGNDNSIMTPTPGVASVLGAGGTFPDGINLAFNDRVKRHLRHYPDPAVRPGGMEFFGSAVSAPQPADVDWVSNMRLVVVPSAERARLGQPITLAWTLTNDSEGPVPVPDRIDAETMIARINVTDSSGRITFMRPPVLDACFTYNVVALEPGAAIAGSTTLFWGKNGFAFETPGRHRVEVLLLWTVAGAPIAASGEADVYVEYPVSDQDNDVAALMLHPEVGKAVYAGEVTGFAAGAERVASVLKEAGSHPAGAFLRERGVGGPAPKPKRRRRG